jgi:hypothetical protein
MIDDSQLKAMLMAKQKEGKITCEEACEIADENGVSRAKVGSLLDELGIRIMACQLGCFG